VKAAIQGTVPVIDPDAYSSAIGFKTDEKI
jgi:hypothetical protein